MEANNKIKVLNEVLYLIFLIILPLICLFCQEEDIVVRHCAYCLNVCGLPIKLCGGYTKRAYCSRECQVKDWSN